MQPQKGQCSQDISWPEDGMTADKLQAGYDTFLGQQQRTYFPSGHRTLYGSKNRRYFHQKEKGQQNQKQNGKKHCYRTANKFSVIFRRQIAELLLSQQKSNDTVQHPSAGHHNGRPVKNLKQNQADSVLFPDPPYNFQNMFHDQRLFPYKANILLFDLKNREGWPFDFSEASKSSSRCENAKKYLAAIQNKSDNLRIYFNIITINSKVDLILEDLNKIDEDKQNSTIAELKGKGNNNGNKNTLADIVKNIKHLQIDLIGREYEELIKDFIKQDNEKNDDANKSREEFVNQDINLLKSFLSKDENEISELTINNCIRAAQILKLYVPQNIPQEETSDDLSDQVNQKSEELESAVRTVLEKIIVGILKDSSLYKSSSSDQ